MPIVAHAILFIVGCGALRVEESDGDLQPLNGQAEHQVDSGNEADDEAEIEIDKSEWGRSADKAGGAHGQILVSGDKTRILKPMDQGNESSAELDAYKILGRTPLGPFLCTLFGTRVVKQLEYMEIASAYLGMEGPKATLDIKMGKITWADNAPQEKINRHKKKLNEIYSNSTAMLGYRVAGMKAGNLTLNSKSLKARRSLVRDEFGAWLFPAFFSSAPGFGSLPPGTAGEVQPEAYTEEVDKQAAREMLGHLKLLSFAAEMGFGGNLRSSSILMTREMRLRGRWALRLIDLAHYTPDKEKDTNFCDGLRNLIKVWEDWLEVDTRGSSE